MGQELTKRQKNIYDTIINTPYTTLQDLSELFGISESTVRREISALSPSPPMPSHTAKRWTG